MFIYLFVFGYLSAVNQGENWTCQQSDHKSWMLLKIILIKPPPFPQNLKKSWHPQTLKNIERVWKAEQKHEAERKKIEELQKELKDERAREEITKYAQETGAVKCVLS